jgi:ABC-2 type transport system permease protein
LDVVLGKFIGRSVVVAGAILLTSIAVGVVALLTYAFFDLDRFLLNTGLMMYQGVVYVAIGVGVSALVNSQQRAVAAIAALLALVFLAWDAFMAVLQWVFIGPLSPGSRLPDWIQFLGVLNPGNAFLFARRALIPEYYEITVYSESAAFFLQDWIGFVILSLWMVLSLGLGYQRFARTEIQPS